MKTLIFEGGSDDLFYETTTGQELCNNASGEPMQFDIVTPDGSGIRVSGCYGGKFARGGCWMIGAEALSEDRMIDWPIRLFPSHGGYHGRMEVDAPDDARVIETNAKAQTPEGLPASTC